jgi:hypothetical protein
MPEPGWNVTEYRGPEGFAALEDDWRRLFAETLHPLMWHSFEAYAVYLADLCPAPQQFRCFALSDGGRVRAILPIEERHERGRVGRGLGLSLRLWGMPLRSGWNVNDAIGPDDDARRALLPAVLAHMRRDPARPAVLDLGRARERSGLWEGLDGLGSATRFAFTDREEYVFPTDMPIEAFMSRMSKNARSIVKRSARKFEALEGARYVRARTPENLATEYECFLAVEGSGWKGAQGSAIRSFPELVAFYGDLTQRLVRDGHCEIHTLHAEGRCIAAGFWVFAGDQASMLKLGYDEEYARLSPGRLMTHRALEYCCEDPAIEVVSIMSNAPWAVHWAPLTNRWRRAFVSLRPVTGTLSVLALRFWYGPLRRIVRRARAWRMNHTGTGGIRGREAVDLASPKR